MADPARDRLLGVVSVADTTAYDGKLTVCIYDYLVLKIGHPDWPAYDNSVAAATAYAHVKHRYGFCKEPMSTVLTSIALRFSLKDYEPIEQLLLRFRKTYDDFSSSMPVRP